MAARITLAESRAVKYWVLGGSISMGIGIWAMHFIGMLAFHLPIPLAYDPGITLVSIIPAILASMLALSILRYRDLSNRLYYATALLMGLGIVVMHYTGMAALQIQPSIQYDPYLFMLSVIIAVVASGAALGLAFKHQGNRKQVQLRHLLSAAVMGLAISGMHYTGMWAARFPHNSISLAAEGHGLDSGFLIVLVSVFSVLVLGITAVVMFIDTIRGEKEFFETLLEAISDMGDGVYVVDEGKPVFANAAMSELTGYDLDELFDRRLFEGIFNELDRDKVLDYLDAETENRLNHRCEVGIRTRDGECRDIELSISSYTYAGRVRMLLLLVDISARKQAIQDLEAQKSETELLARVAAYTDNAVIITDGDGRIEWVNRGFTRISGYTMEEVLGEKPGDFLQGEDTEPETVAYIREKIAAGEGFSAELVNYAKDGRKYWIAINVQPIHNDSGGLEQFIAIERDITDWKEAMLLLEKQKAESEMLAKVAATTDNSVIVLGPDWLTEWVNSGFTRIYGYTLDEVRGKRPGDLIFGPDSDIEARNKIRESINNGQSFKTEVINYDKAGNMHWMAVDGQPILNDEGEIERVFIIESDITEQKQTQTELERLNQTLEQRVANRTEELESQRRFIETVLDIAGCLVLVLDSDCRVVRFNPACEELTGFDLSKRQDVPFWEFLVPEREREQVMATYCPSASNSLVRTLESPILTRSGNESIIVWNNAAIRNDDGSVKYIVMTGIDVTKRKFTENALKHTNAELRNSINTLKDTQNQLVQTEKMASLGGLVAGISHEINTPIGIGVTSASNLAEEVDNLARAYEQGSMKRSMLEEFIDHARQSSSILEKNLRRASELISSFKQVAVDQSSDTWRTLDMHDYVDEIVTSLRPKWKNTAISIINDCDKNVLGYSYPGAIYQVLSNLMINSLTHAFDPGEAGEIRIACKLDNGMLELTYHDNGKGISAEYQSRVFDPFFTTRRGLGGSGLGLHIVFNLINTSLNGQIRLISNIDEGTTFIITFPFSQEKTRAGAGA